MSVGAWDTLRVHVADDYLAALVVEEKRFAVVGMMLVMMI
jgi:hypothetical protein